MGRAYPYFALPEPLPENFVLTILGRAIPLNKESLAHPTGAKARPPFVLKSENLPAAEPVAGGDGTKAADSAPKKSTDSSPGTTLTGSTMYERPEWQRKLYPPQAVVCRNVKVLKEKAIDHETELTIDRVLKAYGKYTNTNNLEFSAKCFRRISMTTPQDQMQNLLDERKKDTYCREFAEPVLELLSQHKELALVTSILTCSDMNKEAGNNTTIQGHTGGGVPDGVPGPPLKGETSTSLTTVEQLSGTYEGEVVIACSYLKLVWRPKELEKPNLAVQFGKMVAGWFGKGEPNERDKIVDKARVPFVSPEAVGMVYLESKLVNGNMRSLFGGQPGGNSESAKTSEELNFVIIS